MITVLFNQLRVPSGFFGIQDFPKIEAGILDFSYFKLGIRDFPYMKVGIRDFPYMKLGIRDFPYMKLGIREFPYLKLGIRDSGFSSKIRASFGIGGAMPKKPSGLKGLHQILGRDYGIEEPCWEISRLR